MSGPFEMIGDDEAGLCVDGVCAVPGPRPAEQQDAVQTDDLADAGPSGRVPVQR